MLYMATQILKKRMFRIQRQDKRAVIRMLVTVVIAFFSCWSPFHSQRLMFVLVTLYGRWNRSLTRAQHILFMVSGTSYPIELDAGTMTPIRAQIHNSFSRRSVLLLQLHPEPHPVLCDVQEVQKSFPWSEDDLHTCWLLQHGWQLAYVRIKIMMETPYDQHFSSGLRARIQTQGLDTAGQSDRSQD